MEIIESWLSDLSDDLKGIYTEGVYHSRWTLIETYHKVGARILNDNNFIKHAQGNGEVLSQVTFLTGIKERELYRAIQFYDKYPSLDLLPDGKNISWHKIVNNLLPETVEQKPEPDICPTCGQAIRGKK